MSLYRHSFELYFILHAKHFPYFKLDNNNAEFFNYVFFFFTSGYLSTSKTHFSNSFSIVHIFPRTRVQVGARIDRGYNSRKATVPEKVSSRPRFRARFLSPRKGTKGKKAKLASGNVGEIRFKWAIVGKIEKRGRKGGGE